MQNYKLAVTKNGKKYTIVFKAETEKLARERVHKEWYSILTVEEVSSNNEMWSAFIFEAFTNEWELKNWKIIWDDILKIYVKLRKNLEYKVKLLFSEKDINLSDDEKKKIIINLEEEYNLFYWNKKQSPTFKSWSNINKDKNKTDNFYLKKELEETYKLIEFVLEKLRKLLSKDSPIELDSNQQEKLNTIYNSIIKFKKSTNISKLKEIWELALLKIWKIELNEVENTHNDNNKILLKETNLLLKKIWSKESFIEKDKDLWLIIKNISNNIIDFFKKYKQKNKSTIDKHSHSYIKNILFLKKYNEKLRENNIFILKNIFKLIFNKEKRIDTLITRRVLKQNIILFKAKERGIWFSYTSVKKGFWKFLEYIYLFLKKLNIYLFIIIFTYTLIFIFFFNYNYYYDFSQSNFKWIFYFLVIILIYLILYLTRNILLIVLNFVILLFIIIFWVVNF